MRNHLFDLWGVRTVNTAGNRTCVANVCALLLNRFEGDQFWNARTIQDEFGELIVNGKSKVQTTHGALCYIEEATGRRRSKTSAHFQECRAIGDYAIFFGEPGGHVIYAVIEPGNVVSVLDGNVGRGWESWAEFLAYAATNESLYTKYPERINRAYRLVEE